MTRCANIIKIRCLLYHFIIVFDDTVTYNDTHVRACNGTLHSSFVWEVNCRKEGEG